MNDGGTSERILEFFHAAAQDPSIIEQYREGGADYLREEWGFTDEDIELIYGGTPVVWSMTVLPQPPIVYPTPPTVLPGKPSS